MSVLALPNMLVPLVPKPEVVPNRLILALKNNGDGYGQVLSSAVNVPESRFEAK